jgi:hypothetical protein
MDPDPAPPAGGDPPAAFDPAPLKAEMLAELRKELNGAVRTMKAEFVKLIPRPADPPPPVDPPVDPPPPGGAPKTPAENALALELKNYRTSSELRIKALETSNLETAKTAEKENRESRVRSEVAKYLYANDKARETAFRLFNSEVTRSEDGSLVANGLPFEKFIETELPNSHAYLLAPKEVGGASARTGNAPGGKKWDLTTVLIPENFNKLSPLEQAEVRQFIATSQ